MVTSSMAQKELPKEDETACALSNKGHKGEVKKQNEKHEKKGLKRS